MIRTRVGYCGGKTPSPTYQAIADHTEAIEIDFDPARTSYARLLEVFFSTHNACGASFSRQYRSAIFYHDDEQRRLAEAAAAEVAKKAGRPVQTAIEPMSGTRFWLAERYHQKFYAQQLPWLAGLLEHHYETAEELVAAPATTRINAAISGYLDAELFERELPELDLPPEIVERLRKTLRERAAYDALETEEAR